MFEVVLAETIVTPIATKSVSATLKPRLWVRYVDSSVATWRGWNREVPPAPKQTAPVDPINYGERGWEWHPILDVHVENKDGRISTRVHRKTTHTDRYINYSSHHHPCIKTGVIQCLRDRAENICDREHARMENHLKKVFQANGYPQSLVHKDLYRHKEPTSCTRDWKREETEDLPSLCTMHLRTHPDGLEWRESLSLKGRCEVP